MASLVSLEDYEKEAAKILPKSALGYYRSGATMEHTLHENRQAFQRWYIRPRFMIDVSKRDMTTSVLGHKVAVPFGVAPTALQKMAHPEGECANARAAGRIGAVFTLSTIATSSIEEVDAAAAGLKFFQLYIYKDRKVTEQLVRRAEKCQYQALVLTVDAPFFGIRYADLRNQFKLPPHLRVANFDNSDHKSKVDTVTEGSSGINEYVASLFDPALNWKDISWLKSITSLPIVLKGILTKEDAELGIKAGASAIWVSNHGARQVDGVLSSIEALPEIVEAVGKRCEIYIDGGFRSGTDIFKALALGATMVFVGRPLLWGLTCNGEEGAYSVLQILKNELESAMALTGCPKITNITREMVTRGYFSSKL